MTLELERNIDFAEARVRATLAQARRVAESEFTFPDGPAALDLIINKLQGHLDEVGSLRAEGIQDKKIIFAECHKALEGVSNVLPILGVILRSTHIRNAFEVYGPIRQVAKVLIGPEGSTKAPPRLIWSSGWDYVPMTFRRIKYLPGFVIITIPASESANPLILPLAGHELGHRVWTDEKIEDICNEPLATAIAQFVKTNYQESYLTIPGGAEAEVENVRRYLLDNARQIPKFDAAILNGSRQAEELFCDLLGYFLFGESFLNAFSYLMSPRPPQDRRPAYPKMSTRAALLESASGRFNTDIANVYTKPDSFVDLFFDDERHVDFWTKATDAAAMAIGAILIEKMIELSSRANWKDLPQLSVEKRVTIRTESYAWGVPASDAGSLGNILNAAWDAVLDKDFWSNFHPLLVQQEKDRRQFRETALREIVLKSIEVFEYEFILRTHGAK